MFFDFGRSEGFPSLYSEHRTPVTVDVLDAGFILAAVILAVSFFISIISTRSYENICLYTRVTLSIIIGILILLGNFGQEWEVGHIFTKTPYKAGTHIEINATIGVKIGLRSVNVTLQSNVDRNGPLKDEMIDYNERFHWTWDQGRFGFGPYAGLLQQEFRKAQYEGVPTPILWIVEYFVIDGEGFRFGRFYRTAGWYSHIAMWCAFPCWLLANIYFRSVIRYGGYCIGLAGFFQLLSNILWITIRNANPLIIPFEDAILTTKYGPTFWLTFSSGILCVSIALAIIIIEYKWYNELYEFFGIDPLINSDEKYLTEEEFNVQFRPKNVHVMDEVPLVQLDNSQKDRARSVIVHVRKDNKTLIKEQIYGNIQTTNLVSPVVEQDDANVADDLPEYLNVSTSYVQEKKKVLPPIPPKLKKRK